MKSPNPSFHISLDFDLGEVSAVNNDTYHSDHFLIREQAGERIRARTSLKHKEFGEERAILYWYCKDLSVLVSIIDKIIEKNKT